LGEVEDALRFTMSQEKAQLTVASFKADQARIKELEGMLNYFNNTGDGKDVRDRVF
tara:strand:+ start:1584 stop:1751 length:168 start_codon:yes stop_codon:yes gene_type:complete